jgi:signal peptidase I
MSDKKKFKAQEASLEQVVIGEEEEINFENKSDSEELVTDVSVASPIKAGEEEVVTEEELNKGENKGKKQLYLTIYDFVSIIMASFIVVAVIFSFFFRVVSVDGESMEDTLKHKDVLLTVNKSEYVYGDIVVITQDTYFKTPLIKRVIAVGGQTVDINYDTNTVYVDGVALDEPYVKEYYLAKKGGYREFPYTVPEGYLFCMGDNRNNSSDSRSDLVGPVDEREILGKAVIRIMPFGDSDIYDYE